MSQSPQDEAAMDNNDSKTTKWNYRTDRTDFPPGLDNMKFWDREELKRTGAIGKNAIPSISTQVDPAGIISVPGRQYPNLR
jgi:hypothetical protein